MQMPPPQSSVQIHEPVSLSQLQAVEMHCIPSRKHTSPSGQGIWLPQPAGFEPGHSPGPPMQTPPPQSSVQIHEPVSASHVQAEGMHCVPSRKHTPPSGQPVCTHPAGLGSSHFDVGGQRPSLSIATPAQPASHSFR
jgi:hypothetical protein